MTNQEYINKVKQEVRSELGNEVSKIQFSMVPESDVRDAYVLVRVTFQNKQIANFKFEVWRFAMRTDYISSDVDIIVNTIRNYMINNEIPPHDSHSDEDAWEFVSRKSVRDSDGFLTDYTLYHNRYDDRYVCIFGDSDLYDPTNAEPDFECEEKWEAKEWFDSYTGPGDDEDDYDFDWMNDDVESSCAITASETHYDMNATDVVTWMYEEFPEWAFYDEHELADGRIMLKFDNGPKYQREDLEEALDSKGLSYVIRNQLIIFAPEDPEYEGVEASTSLADDFIRIHDKDEINWQMQDYNYDPFYEELKAYMVEGETWDDEDEEGYPADTNVDLKTLFARMPEDKQRDFLDRFWIHNNSKHYVKSDWNIEDQIDAPDTIGKLNPGDKFVNRNNVEITIIEPSKDGRVQYTVGDECRIGSEKSIQQMLYRNNYMRKVESSSEIIDMGLGNDVEYWYFTTHGVQPGSVPRGLVINQVIDKPEGTYFSANRVISTDALKYYDIKERAPR